MVVPVAVVPVAADGPVMRSTVVIERDVRLAAARRTIVGV
jgi:hypothetical protein